MPISNEARRIPHKQAREHIEWVQTHRFIEEVHRLEQEGRVPSRKLLEENLFLRYGSITSMRGGRLRVGTAEIYRLKHEYNGDFQYILIGMRDRDISGPLKAGRDLRQHKGYAFPYSTEGVDLLKKAGLPTQEG